MKKSDKSWPERHKEAMAKYRAKHAFVQLPKELHAELKIYCEDHGFVMSRFVTNLIRKHFKSVQ